jgi:pantoate--beta-alanine ligase
MQTLSSIDAIRQQLRLLKQEGKKIGFVPTMGALHEGHLSLVEYIKPHVDHIVVSIFVNPKQFAPNEDFDQYPRTLEDDIRLLEPHGVGTLYTPTAEQIYPDSLQTEIHVGQLGRILEGVARPHFFDGVVTVVNKLFNIVTPDVAVFGEKDYQQLCVIRNLAQDFNMPVEILGAPIIRETDGLALSSRNRYLSKEAKKLAPLLHQTLTNIKEQLLKSQNVAPALANAKEQLLTAGFEKIDYLSLCDAHSLEEVLSLKKPTRLLVAAYLENVRLIDNILVS